MARTTKISRQNPFPQASTTGPEQVDTPPRDYSLNYGPPEADPNSERGIFESGEALNAVKPTSWDQFKAMADEVSARSPLGGEGALYGVDGSWTTFLRRQSIRQDIESGQFPQKQLTPDEANSRYPGMPEKFDEPIYDGVAKDMYDEFRRKQRSREWVAKGTPPNIFLSGAAQATTALDPLFLALNFATGGAARALSLPVKGLAGAATVLGENLAISSALSASSYAIEKQGHQAPDPEDAVVGALVGAAVGTTIHLIGRGIKNRYFPDKQASETKNIVRQDEVGAKVSPPPATPLEQIIQGESAAAEHPLTQPGVESEFYASQAPDGHYIDMGAPPLFEDMGADLVTSKNLAKHSAVGDDGLTLGTTRRATIGSHEGFISMDEPLGSSKVQDSGLMETLNRKLQELNPKGPVDYRMQQESPAQGRLGYPYTEVTREGFKPTDTVQDLIHRLQFDVMVGLLPEDALKTFRFVLNSKGFSGLTYSVEENGRTLYHGVKYLNERVPRFNLDEAVKPEDRIKPTAEQELGRMQAEDQPSNSKLADPETDQRAQKWKSEAPAGVTEHHQLLKDQEAALDQHLEILSKDDPALKAEVENISGSERESAELEAVKQLTDCALEHIL